MDDLLYVAAGRGLIVNQSLPRTTASQTHVLAVQQGHDYNVALVWFRHDPNGLALSNLDLEVSQGTAVLGRSITPENAYEFVRFRAPATGLVTLTVRNVTIEAGLTALPYALVAAETGPFYVRGSATAFGTACRTATNLSVTGVPTTGSFYSVRYPGNTTAPTILATGASSTNWLGIPLPLDLTGAGMPGCTLYVAIDLTEAFTGSQTGGTIFITLPNDPVLVGTSLFHQAVTVPSPIAIATSNALRVLVGGQM